MIPEFNIDSPDHRSILLFGGFLKIEVYEPVLEDGDVVIYKTGQKKGQIKVKKVVKEIYIKGMGLQPPKEWETKKKGFYKVNKKTMKVLLRGDHHDLNKFIELREKESRLKKIISTYYDRTERNLYPDQMDRGYFGHVGTVTARLSGDKQQIPKPSTAKVRQIYVSRYDEQ